MGEISGQVTDKARENLKNEEGFRNSVYDDGWGNLTVGWGHKLSTEEKEKYPEVYVFKESDRPILEAWFTEDTKKAYDAARNQVGQLKNPTQELVNSFTSVNYQLGSSWYEVKFDDAWKAMKDGDFIKATKELFWANDTTYSKWYKQTPNRVKDFARALVAHHVTVDKREMFPDEHIMKEVIVNP